MSEAKRVWGTGGLPPAEDYGGPSGGERRPRQLGAGGTLIIVLHPGPSPVGLFVFGIPAGFCVGNRLVEPGLVCGWFEDREHGLHLVMVRAAVLRAADVKLARFFGFEP